MVFAMMWPGATSRDQIKPQSNLEYIKWRHHVSGNFKAHLTVPEPFQKIHTYILIYILSHTYSVDSDQAAQRKCMQKQSNTQQHQCLSWGCDANVLQTCNKWLESEWTKITHQPSSLFCDAQQIGACSLPHSEAKNQC